SFEFGFRLSAAPARLVAATAPKGITQRLQSGGLGRCPLSRRQWGPQRGVELGNRCANRRRRARYLAAANRGVEPFRQRSTNALANPSPAREMQLGANPLDLHKH